MENKHIHRRHSVSLLMYHFVCPAKYRKTIFIGGVEESLIEICREIEKRYEIKFEEIGADENHVHFLIQGLPKDAPYKIIGMVKSLTAKHLFAKHPEIKKQLRGGALWTSGYYVNTVGMYGGYDVIKKYVSNQGKSKEYTQRYQSKTLESMGLSCVSLFD